MSTIIAIKTNFDMETIVFVADRQMSETDEDGNGERRPIDKLYTGKNWVAGDVGGDDREVRRFYGILRGDKRFGSSEETAQRILERSLRRQRQGRTFPEIARLNTKLSAEDVPNDELHQFIFGVNYPSLEIWRIDRMGNFHEVGDDKEFDYICLGSGAERAEQKIRQMLADEEINRDRIDTDAAMHLGRKAYGGGERDNSTGLGYDLIVMSSEGMDDIGKKVRKDIAEYELQRIKELGTKYRRPQP